MNWWEANWWSAQWWFARWWTGGEGGGDADRPEIRVSTPFGPDVIQQEVDRRKKRADDEALIAAFVLSEDR